MRSLTASARGYVDIVRLLLEAGANKDVLVADSSRRTALHWASLAGAIEIIGLLLAAGASKLRHLAEIEGRTALMRASSEGYAGIGSMLLEAGIRGRSSPNRPMPSRSLFAPEASSRCKQGSRRHRWPHSPDEGIRCREFRSGPLATDAYFQSEAPIGISFLRSFGRRAIEK